MLSRLAATTVLMGALVGLAGCGSSQEAVAPAKAAAQTDTAAHEHGAWWCDEHGVPEEECALCDPKLVATFKEKGDWCRDHERPDSQCFVCHPEREQEFAARYEARYGRKPPKPTS